MQQFFSFDMTITLAKFVSLVRIMLCRLILWLSQTAIMIKI